MAKTPPNHGTPWSKREDAALKQYGKEIGVSLKQTDQRPYNRIT